MHNETETRTLFYSLNHLSIGLLCFMDVSSSSSLPMPLKFLLCFQLRYVEFGSMINSLDFSLEFIIILIINIVVSNAYHLSAHCAWLDSPHMNH